MLHEYALDPGVLRNFEKVRYYLEKFGVHRGRLISRFPKKWKKMVYEACASCRDIEKARIVESLSNVDTKLISSSRDYDGNVLWLENAEAQHISSPFHAIISSENPRRSETVLIDDDLTEHNPLWNISREQPVLRKAEVLAACVKRLLQISTTIVFVDPHFDPKEERYQKTLRAFAEATVGNLRLKEIKYHLKEDDKKPSGDYFHAQCRKYLPSLLPKNLKITFVRWRQIVNAESELPEGEKPHPRYVLTERGGFRIEQGLDEGYDGETTDISLLDLPVHQQRWKDYRESPAFKFVDEITIVGS